MDINQNDDGIRGIGMVVVREIFLKMTQIHFIAVTQVNAHQTEGNVAERFTDQQEFSLRWGVFIAPMCDGCIAPAVETIDIIIKEVRIVIVIRDICIIGNLFIPTFQIKLPLRNPDADVGIKIRPDQDRVVEPCVVNAGALAGGAQKHGFQM